MQQQEQQQHYMGSVEDVSATRHLPQSITQLMSLFKTQISIVGKQK